MELSLSLALAEMIVFHGSPLLACRRAFGLKNNESIEVCPGRPFFVTASRSFAIHFARGGTLSSFRMGQAIVLDGTAPENVDKLLELFNGDACSPNSPWDEDLWGDPEESTYLLLESKAVWDYLVDMGVDAVRIIEQMHPRIESFAILNPAMLEHVKTITLASLDSQADPEP